MADTDTRQIASRSARIDASEAWYYRLDQGALSAIDHAVAKIRQISRPIVELCASDFDLAPLAGVAGDVRHALEHGRGFAIVETLDVDRYARDEATAIYWLFGQLLGEPFEQNVQGTLLYDVRDTGQNVADGARFSVTNYESSFHTDNSFGSTVLDYVGLLCLRSARSGGVSQLVDGYAVEDELRRRGPEALATLRAPFHVDRRGGLRPGEEPTAYAPVIAHDGGIVYRYLRYWIEAGHQKVGQPLTVEQIHALDLLDEVLADRRLGAEFMMKPGQMQFINNRTILHNRTAFEDWPELDRRRHLVRLWLCARAA